MTASIPSTEREMILHGVGTLAANEGYEALTLAHIRRQVGIPRRRFEEHFADVEDCFVAALELYVTRNLVSSWGATLEGNAWPNSVYRAVAGLCQALAENQPLRRLLFIESVNAGPGGVRWRAKLITNLSSSLRDSAPPQERPSILTAEASVAAVWTLLESRARGGRGRCLIQLVRPAAYLLLAPAIGADAAVEVIQKERHSADAPRTT